MLAAGGDARLGAVRRELTVLFSDIGGFTTVVEGNEPEVVLAALGTYLDGMNDAVDGSRGTVCQYLGDGIMAFWGAPEPLVDHAVQACRGALAMQAHADRLLEEATQTGAPPLPTRMGINSGEVLVGNIGAHERFNYGILGDTVNATARMESLNKVYGTRILVGERTIALAGQTMAFRAVDRVLLKGKRHPTRVFELLGEAGAVSESMRACTEAYEAGLGLLASQRFTDALVCFQAAHVHRPGDGPSQLMEDRCRGFIAEPPPASWDGVTVLSEK